ncbi:hypothetical protein SDC9_140981 [bioreactor metagenome]|uniref:Uncharacterized protein n=1 Tax=bioreactor metagenome TaxID=1076179 RepID=A0A645DX48_9ZZZZ
MSCICFSVFFKLICCEKIDDDVVVVSGEQRDFIAAAAHRGGARDIKRLITVKRRALYCDYSVDFTEAAPVIIGEEASADRRLEIKADDR